MKPIWFFFLILLVWARVIPGALAYTDEVLTTSPEIWQAARDVLEPYGIHRENAKKDEIVSGWIKDRVKRKRRIFPVQVNVNDEVQHTFDRRYRIRVRLSEKETGTEVKIQGQFQEKSLSGRPQTPWRKVQPRSEDFQIERDFFFRILKRLEANRRAAALAV